MGGFCCSDEKEEQENEANKKSPEKQPNFSKYQENLKNIQLDAIEEPQSRQQSNQFTENSYDDQDISDEEEEEDEEEDIDEEGEENEENENSDDEDDFHNLLMFQLHLKMVIDQLQQLMEIEMKKQQDEQERNACPKAIEVHYSCQKQQKCQSNKRNSFFLHKQCKKKAWFQSDCQIKCEGSCPSFSIRQAYFVCRNKYVIQSDLLMSQSSIRVWERITNLMQLSELIKNSLDHSEYSNSQQLNFQKKVFESPCFQQIMLQK